MSQKHKAPTQVTIAATEEEGVLHQLVQRFWAPALGAVLIVAAIVVVRQYQALSREEEAADSWVRLGQDVNLASTAGTLTLPAASVLSDLAVELENDVSGPWAKALEVGKHIEDGDEQGARQAAEDLEATWPDHPLATEDLFPKEDGAGSETLRRHLESASASRKTWETAHPGLFANPPLPEDAPKVKIHTTAGDIVVGLYEEYAPRHVENFLKLCGEGFYDGVKFHRVIKDFMIQGGSPTSRDDENPDSWSDGGPGYTLDPETGTLWHFPGALSAASTQPGGPTSGSQFFIVTGAKQHHLDGDYTVFGTVLEGQDTVSAIENGAVLGDRPENPVVIESTEIL